MEALAANPRAGDHLRSLTGEVRYYATKDARPPDQSERDAMVELANRAELLLERLEAIIDWADFATAQPIEFDSDGVRNLAGPVFDEARDAIAKAEGKS